jgi:adenine-specific DNA-methyltransferase
MKPLADPQIPLIPSATGLPAEVSCFPRFRYMGSKFRLLTWIHDALSDIDFETATDAFSGSGAVSYLLKSMGKQVRANDTLAFPSVLTACDS